MFSFFFQPFLRGNTICFQQHMICQPCLFLKRSIIHMLVTTQYDYYNMLYMEMPLKEIQKLHQVPNAAAKLLWVVPKGAHDTCFDKNILTIIFWVYWRSIRWDFNNFMSGSYVLKELLPLYVLNQESWWTSNKNFFVDADLY